MELGPFFGGDRVASFLCDVAHIAARQLISADDGTHSSFGKGFLCKR
jgi:hypothetical protein